MVTLLGILIFGNSMAAEIYLECDGKEYSVSLNDSQEAKEFLKQLPQELKFEDYGAFERIAYLTKNLAPVGPANGFTPLTGDLTYYAPWGNLAVFIKRFSALYRSLFFRDLIAGSFEIHKRIGEQKDKILFKGLILMFKHEICGKSF